MTRTERQQGIRARVPAELVQEVAWVRKGGRRLPALFTVTPEATFYSDPTNPEDDWVVPNIGGRAGQTLYGRDFRADPKLHFYLPFKGDDWVDELPSGKVA